MCDVIQAGIVPVGEDGGTLGLEFFEVVNYEAAEEGGAVFEGRFVDDDGGAFRLYPLHDALYAALTEVVGVGFHRESVDSDCRRSRRFPLSVFHDVGGVVVPSCHAEHLVGDEVLTGAVALDDCCHHVLGHVLVVGEELFCVFGEAVTAVAERGIVVMGADARVEPYAFDDCLRIESFYLGICVEFVEIADAQGKIGVGEELDCLCLLHAHV